MGENVGQGLAPAVYINLYFVGATHVGRRRYGFAQTTRTKTSVDINNCRGGSPRPPEKTNNARKYNPSASQARHLPLDKGGFFCCDMHLICNNHIHLLVQYI